MKKIGLQILALLIVFAAINGVVAQSTLSNQLLGQRQEVTQAAQSSLPGKYIQLESEPGIISRKMGYSEADPGKQYILVKINVENHGYNEFKLNPYLLKMTVNKITYDRNYLSAMAENGYPPLEDVTLEDGGMISGYVAFTVPSGVTEYALKYDQYSWDSYNIIWK
ncbi:MAG: DUF4352 domain-containing protein [Methanothrix sp.]